MPCSRHTTERRISQISADIVATMQNDLLSSNSFILAFDDFTEIPSNLQLAICARYVSSKMTVKEELLDMVALKETMRGIDIKDALDKVLTKAQVPLKKLVSVATNGAGAMVGKRLGLIALIKNDPKFPNFF